MELKLKVFNAPLGENECFNRTFMELKRRYAKFRGHFLKVLIVPLWN